jgi:hypothetical protein
VARAALSRLEKRTSGSCRNYLSRITQTFLHNLTLIEKWRLMPWSAYKRKGKFALVHFLFRERSTGFKIGNRYSVRLPIYCCRFAHDFCRKSWIYVEKLAVIATNENKQSLILLLSLLAVAWQSGFCFGQNDLLKEENINKNQSSILGTAPVGFEGCQNLERILIKHPHRYILTLALFLQLWQHLPNVAVQPIVNESSTRNSCAPSLIDEPGFFFLFFF